MSMPLFILTGGIGCGKSTFAKYLNENGVAIIDTDVLSRRVMDPGMPGYLAVRSKFGPSFFDKDLLNRSMLASYVFGDKTGNLKSTLEACTHPYINSMVKKELIRIFLRHEQVEGVPYNCVVHEYPQAVCIVIPLYFEAGLDKRGFLSTLPVVACVVGSTDEQIKRLKYRMYVPLNESEARARIDHQMDMRKKGDLVSYVIDNSGSIYDLEERVFEFIENVMFRLKPRRSCFSPYTSLYDHFTMGLISTVVVISITVALISVIIRLTNIA